MSLLNWRDFSRRPDIQHLPLQEQLYLFEQENKRKTEQNWFLEAQLTAGGAGGGFAGNASDGPIAGATVTTDVGTTTTDALGNFTFAQTPTTEITVTGGTDSITGVAFTGELKGFPQYKTVSPLTTLAFHLKEEDTSLTADTAVDLLFASSSTLFGIELEVADKDVMLNKDYVAESVERGNQKAIAAQSIATYLESVTEMVGSAVKGADDVNFTTNNAKIEGYKSIARQIKDTVGAKTEIDPETLFDKVKLPSGARWQGDLTGSLNTTARQSIKTQLTAVKDDLAILAQSEAFTANYLTTKIQAINRGVKENYKEDARRLAGGTSVTFDNMETLIGKATGSLAQIERGKTNETTRIAGDRSETFYTLGTMTFTQNGETLSGDAYVSGSMKAIAASNSNFTQEDALRKYIIKPNGDSLSLRGATNWSGRAGDITATQTTVSPENAAANKVIQLTLKPRTHKITAFALVDAPATGHIFSTGTYTLSMAESRVTQVLTINSGTPNTLLFGEIRGLNISTSITVTPDPSDATKFVVAINSNTVTPRGGTAFSGTGNNSTLTFTFNRTAYTLTYTT